MTEPELVLSLTTIPFLVVGFIGNVLVIRIVHKTREMHTPTNYLLANFADHLEYQSDGLRTFICKTFGLIAISFTVSSITLTMLALERYHALLKPFRTRLRLKENSITYAIAFIWVASVIICFPEFIFKEFEWSERYSTCVGPWTLHMNQAAKVCVLITAIFIYIKLMAVSYCYGALIRGIYFTKTVCAGRAHSGERNAERTQLVFTFLLATIGFFIGVFFTVLASQSDEHLDLKLNSVLLSVFVVVFHYSLCFNPILYAFRSTNFKLGFKRIICMGTDDIK